MARSVVLTEVSEQTDRQHADISLGQGPTVGAQSPPSCKGDDSHEGVCRHGIAAAPAEETPQCDVQLLKASLAAGSHPQRPPEVQQAAASGGTGAVPDAGGASASSSTGKSRAQPEQAWRAEAVEPAAEAAEAAGEAAATAEADVIKASTVGTPVADTPAVLTSAAVDGAVLQMGVEAANPAAGTTTAALAVVAVAGGTEQRIGSTMLPAEVVQSPVGVKFVEDGSSLLRDQEMVRLLRQPRYFHDDFLEATVTASRCFNCGKPGHRASACTAEARLRPCYLCAQLGHEGKDCPARRYTPWSAGSSILGGFVNSYIQLQQSRHNAPQPGDCVSCPALSAELCFRCGRPGHKSRECPVQNDVSWETGRSRCLRCASLTCACANKADYFRCVATHRGMAMLCICLHLTCLYCVALLLTRMLLYCFPQACCSPACYVLLSPTATRVAAAKHTQPPTWPSASVMCAGSTGTSAANSRQRYVAVTESLPVHVPHQP